MAFGSLFLFFFEHLSNCKKLQMLFLRSERLTVLSVFPFLVLIPLVP